MYIWTFIIIPLMWAVLSKIIWHKDISWKEFGLHVFSVCILTIIVLSVGYFSNLYDTEIIHGSVTSKQRDHSSYQESYSCNCVQVCTGSGNNRSCHQSCSTCYRTVYTVDWYLESTIGNISIDSARSYYSSVYGRDDPELFVNAYIGEPCSKTQLFKNYVKASPNSLFNNSKYGQGHSFTLPEYPSLYSIYKVDNVINQGVKVDTKRYEVLLSEKLKTLGASKQVNIILLFVNEPDQRYKLALEKHWVGGKQNDLVLIISTDGDKVHWVDGFSFGLSQGNHLLISKLKDDIIKVGIEEEVLISTISENVKQYFTRKKMEDFKYLNKEVQPPLWLVLFLIVLQIVLNFVITRFNIKNDL